MKIKLIYQISKGAFVVGLRIIKDDGDLLIDTMTSRVPAQVVEESEFYNGTAFVYDDPIEAIIQHVRTLFPQTMIAFESKDLVVVEYDYDKEKLASKW